MWLTGLNFKIAAMLLADWFHSLPSWWKETFYLLPSQLDERANIQTEGTADEAP